MSSKKEYVYCIWAHSKVNGPSPYIYRMVATSKADVKRKWAESFYWHLTIDHIEKADITPEYLNRPYDFDDDNDDRLIGQYITVDPKESPLFRHSQCAHRLILTGTDKSGYQEFLIQGVIKEASNAGVNTLGPQRAKSCRDFPLRFAC